MPISAYVPDKGILKASEVLGFLTTIQDPSILITEGKWQTHSMKVNGCMEPFYMPSTPPETLDIEIKGKITWAIYEQILKVVNENK